VSLIIYRSYAAEVGFDVEKSCLSGKVTGIEQEIIFQANTLPELKQAFHQAVDHYLSEQKEQATQVLLEE